MGQGALQEGRSPSFLISFPFSFRDEVLEKIICYNKREGETDEAD